jgi:IS4 transposase
MVNTDIDVLNVFDRGYVDYKSWDTYCEQGICFVSRLKANAIIDKMKSELFQINSSFVTESTVLLGKPQTTQMKHSLRLFKTHDSQGNPVIIVTNDFCMDALEITEIYQLRLQVELFFKWIKQH